MAKALLIVAVVLAILFNLLGLMGAYKEHYCMTVTFAVLNGIATVISIVNAVKLASYWFTFIVNLLVTVLAVWVSMDIRNDRNGPTNYS